MLFSCVVKRRTGIGGKPQIVFQIAIAAGVSPVFVCGDDDGCAEIFRIEKDGSGVEGIQGISENGSCCIEGQGAIEAH